MVGIAGGTAGAATKSPIRIGLVTSVTGAAAQNFIGAVQGTQAAFDVQNAKGGIDGHKLELVVGDDTSTVQGATTAVSDLIDSKKVFSLIFISDLVSAGYRVAQQADVPVIGAPIDGPEWGEQPNTNMVSIQGDRAATPPATTMYSQVAKDLGAKNMAGLAIANEQPSIIGVQNFVKGSKAIGLKVGYVNESTPIGSVNVSSLVLAMKQAGVDGYDSAMLDTTNFAIMETAKQDGLKLVAPMQDVGYTEALLTTATARAGSQGGIFYVLQTPTEEHTAATDKETAAFKKYEHYTGVPNLNWTYGWLSGNLTIAGLEKVHGDATRAKFLSAVRSIHNWTGGGLLPEPETFSLADFGKTPTTKACAYFVKLEGKAFIPLNGGKPFCGKYLK